MDERDYDIAMVEVIAANDALEQEWRMSLAGRRGQNGGNIGNGDSGSNDTQVYNGQTPQGA